MSVYALEVMLAANGAARDYIEGGDSFLVRLVNDQGGLLVALPIAAGSQNSETGAVTWAGDGLGEAVANGEPDQAILTRIEDGEGEPCITLPVAQGSEPVAGQAVMDLNPFTVEVGKTYGITSITIPGI
jgi:hypothetical protein